MTSPDPGDRPGVYEKRQVRVDFLQLLFEHTQFIAQLRCGRIFGPIAFNPGFDIAKDFDVRGRAFFTYIWGL